MLKYKKYQKGSLQNKFSSFLLNIYHYNTNILRLKTQNFGKCSVGQIKAFKQIIIKKTKKTKSQIFLNIPTIFPLTKKPLEVRMGKGKGNVSTYVSKKKVGCLICKLKYKNLNQLPYFKKIIKNASLRLSIKTKIK